MTDYSPSVSEGALRNLHRISHGQGTGSAISLNNALRPAARTTSRALQHRRTRPSSRKSRPLLQLAFHVADHFVSGVEGTIKGSFLRFIQLRVDFAALLGGVLVAGGWQFRQNRDDAARYFELHYVAGLKTSLMLYCRRHGEADFILDGSGHRKKTKITTARRIAELWNHRLRQNPPSHTDVFIPELRPGLNESRHERDALGVLKDLDLYPITAQVILRSLERLVLPYHHSRNFIQDNGAAAHRTR